MDLFLLVFVSANFSLVCLISSGIWKIMCRKKLNPRILSYFTDAFHLLLPRCLEAFALLDQLDREPTCLVCLGRSCFMPTYLAFYLVWYLHHLNKIWWIMIKSCCIKISRDGLGKPLLLLMDALWGQGGFKCWAVQAASPECRRVQRAWLACLPELCWKPEGDSGTLVQCYKYPSQAAAELRYLNQMNVCSRCIAEGEFTALTGQLRKIWEHRTERTESLIAARVMIHEVEICEMDKGDVIPGPVAPHFYIECVNALPEHLTRGSYPERWSRFNSGLTHDWSHFPKFVELDPRALGDMDALASGLFLSPLPLCCDLGSRVLPSDPATCTLRAFWSGDLMLT